MLRLAFTLVFGAAVAANYELHSREADPCLTTDGACSWLFSLVNCTENNFTCICNVYEAATSTQLQACVACEQPINATFASEQAGFAQFCASGEITDPCFYGDGACAWYFNANCTVPTCVCNVIQRATSSQIQDCVLCEQPRNATFASEFAGLAEYCDAKNSSSESPSGTPAVTTASSSPRTISFSPTGGLSTANPTQHSGARTVFDSTVGAARRFISVLSIVVGVALYL